MEFCLPDLGEGIVDAELVQWMVEPGESVKRGQSLAEIMTDKATLELPANFSGKIIRLLAAAGDQVNVDAPLLEYELSDQAVHPHRPATSATELGTVSAASLKPSAQITSSEPSASEESSPSSSPINGNERSPSPAAVAASPLLRRMANQLDIDLADIQGSGPENRILADDLAAYLKRTRKGESAYDRDSSGVPTRHRSQEHAIAGSRIKLRGLRRVIARRTAHANQTIPHFGYVDQCDVTDLVRMRDSLKPQFAEAGVKLTYLPFFVKALVEGLKEFPLFNSSLDETAGEIVLHDRFDIGIAMDTANGLLVPVIRDVDCKSLRRVATEISRLSDATRGGSASAEDLRGSTFTVTSIGSIGGLISTPIINEPEVGIMGIGRIVRQPKYDDRGNLRPADLVYLSYSFDHRVIDGADAARFSNAVIKRLQNPAMLLMLEQ